MASTTGTRLDALLSAALGAVAAAATIAILHTDPPPPVEERPRPHPAREVGEDPDGPRLERIERELARLGCATHEPAPKDAAALTADVEDLAPPPDPRQEYAEQQAMKEDWLRRHAMEAVDTSWARDAERDIDLDLERLRDEEWAGRDPIDFEVVDVSCRTSLCVVAVEWDSARTAVEDGAYLAMHDYAQSCTVTVYGPSLEEIETEESFRQEIVFDCA